ncbi:MAG: CBS domain-containing protein [bacterium]
MNTLVIAIGGFISLLILLIILRVKGGSSFEIKNSDIVLALIPIALWLFLTGKIQEFSVGDLKIVSAIREASKSPVAPQVTQLPVESVQVDRKAGIEAIPDLVRKKTQALSFSIGHGGYWGTAIREYLDALTQYPAIRYIVINDSKGHLFGIADARQLAAIVLGSGRPFTSQNFADWLNSSNTEQLKALLPGFIPAENALNKYSDKVKALKIMDSLDVQTLPIVDDAGNFIGIVDRSKLTASILLSIDERLEAGK